MQTSHRPRVTSAAHQHSSCTFRQGAWRRPNRNRCRSNVTQVAAEHASSTRTHKAPVEVEVENTSWTSRKLFAKVPIAAPVNVVWGCLTDYDNLHTFIPSLEENRCLERRPAGAILYQVGAQEVALGLKFSAAVTLEIQEHPDGLPDDQCRVENSAHDCFFPIPRTAVPGQSAQDISFSLLEGDFEAFRGVWRMQAATASGSSSTLLTYSVFVQPQKWLPVGLIQSRIQKEIRANLDAVRVHAERLMRAQQRQQQQRPQQQRQQQHR